MKYRNVAIGLLAIIWLAGCGSANRIPSELQGAYVSDKEATLDRWTRELPFGDRTDRMIEGLSPILGKARMDLSERTVRLRIDDYDSEVKIDFVEIVSEGIRIGYYSDVYDRQLVSLLKPTPDGYWVISDDIIPGYIEKFKHTANQSEMPTP